MWITFTQTINLQHIFLQKNARCRNSKSKQKNIPKKILQAKLKHGEIIAKDQSGVVVLKSKDMRDARMLSTKHVTVEATQLSSRNN